MTIAWKNPTPPWEPRRWQTEAVTAWQNCPDHVDPVIRAVTGAGKSVVIAELAALTFHGRVVVITPTVKLVDQLHGTLKARGIPHVGRYYTHEKNSDAAVIVCCNDSFAALSRKIEPASLLIIDEVHRSECDQIHNVILGEQREDGTRDESTAWVPRKRVGFTATPYRSKDSEKLSLFTDLIYNYGPAKAIRDGVVVRPRVHHYEGEAGTIDEACIEMIREMTGPGIVDAINIADATEFAELLRQEGFRAKTVHSKLHEQTVEKRLQQLEMGDLDCVVHVSLLSEGVDLPWLRWLCCRRPIASKVLFAQYVGRGLRKNDEMLWGNTFLSPKKWCDILDPNDLFGKLSLDYEAVLSGDIADENLIPDLPALELDWAVDELLSVSEPDTLRGVPITVIDPTVAFIRRLRLSFQFLGLASMIIGRVDWREDEPTDRQVTRICRDAWVINEPEVPPHQRRALVIAIKAIRGCDRGTASDLIAILDVLKSGWPEEQLEQEAA